MRVALAAAFLAAFPADAVRTTSDASESIAAYEAFLREFGVQSAGQTLDMTPRGETPMDFTERMELFLQRREQVEAHNALPDKLWVAAVNHLADHTDEEFQVLLGHRSSSARRGRAMSADNANSLMQLQPANVGNAEVAVAVDYRTNLTHSVTALDQGRCGSCWAVAAAGALETRAEMLGSPRQVSYEQIVDCTPNPQECGGTGGCHGATAELAFDYVQKHGLVARSHYQGYQSGGDGECNEPTDTRLLQTSGFVRLPENKLQPLMAALTTQGPVVVSVDGSNWMMYSKGIFNECSMNAVTNHAVLAMGYGTDTHAEKDYWLIRNSWGPRWGEGGFLRLLRHNSDEGAAGYCGTDRNPKAGVACKGGPAEVPVCGMCGVLSDSAYPTNVKVM